MVEGEAIDMSGFSKSKMREETKCNFRKALESAENAMAHYDNDIKEMQKLIDEKTESIDRLAENISEREAQSAGARVAINKIEIIIKDLPQ